MRTHHVHQGGNGTPTLRIVLRIYSNHAELHYCAIRNVHMAENLFCVILHLNIMIQIANFVLRVGFRFGVPQYGSLKSIVDYGNIRANPLET